MRLAIWLQGIISKKMALPSQAVPKHITLYYMTKNINSTPLCVYGLGTVLPRMVRPH